VYVGRVRGYYKEHPEQAVANNLGDTETPGRAFLECHCNLTVMLLLVPPCEG
jgi:hypothetical protein